MRIDRHAILKVWARMDWVMLGTVAGLLVIGYFYIYSAVQHGFDVDPLHRQQRIWALLGFAGLLTATAIDYRRLYPFAWVLYVFGIVLLVLVLLVGVSVRAAARWLVIAGIPVQPAEFAKLSTITMLAAYMGRPGVSLKSPLVLVKALLIAAIPFALIAAQPDLGTAFVLLPVTLVILFLAGVPIRYLLLLAVVGLMLLPVGWVALGDYQKDRILVFLEPGRDPFGKGWSKMQSVIAVGSGGLLGKGYLEGTQNILGFLPRTVAPTDFIFSVLAEESGFIGSAGILLLFFIMLIRGVETSLVARDRFGQLLSAGLATMIFTHVFVNVAMTIGVLPVTGLPLPFISYGGSFMISIMLAVGLIQSVYVRRYSY